MTFCQMKNMNRAYKQVIKNKGAAGIDGMECNDLFSHLKVNGHQLRESIRNQSYKTNASKKGWRFLKDNGSKRKTWNTYSYRPHDSTGGCTVLTPIYETENFNYKH